MHNASDTNELAQAAQKATKAASDRHLAAGHTIVAARGADIIEMKKDNSGQIMEKIIGKVAAPSRIETERIFNLVKQPILREVLLISRP